MKQNELLEWVWLSLACRSGSVLPSTLLKFFGSPKAVFEATEEDFNSIDTNFYGHKDALCDKNTAAAESVLKYCKKNGIGITTPDDYFYPQRFRSLPNKPMVLYYVGNFCDLDNRFIVGVVGSRNPSEYGIHAAKRISYDLARSGAVIASGMAAGIDAAAHRAALYHGSFTVGILGCGIDKVYPKENEELYTGVMQSGLVMTEFPPGTSPLGRNFPVRNRLIAALSNAVCVVEGSEQSGALITAEDALKQGKGLYSVPGSIFSYGSAGSNFLLKVGAKPCLSAYDIVEDYRLEYPELRGALSVFGKKEETKTVRKKKEKNPDIKKKIRSYIFPGSGRKEEKEVIPPEYEFVMVDEIAKDPAKEEKTVLSPLPTLSEEERKIYGKLGFDPVLADSLVSEDIRVSDVLRILTKLEMKGLVQKVSGGKFVLTDRAEA